MAVRTDIVVIADLEPRLILVQAPSTEVVLQDLHDTLRAWEDSPVGQGYTIPIISSDGKQDLGGGVTVGLTSTLENAQLMFEARTTPLATGTATTATLPLAVGDYTTIQLIDNVASFSGTVEPGDLVYNKTDNSWATIIEIVSNTELTCFELGGGTDNDFDLTDSYEIYRIYQCNITGGNLVARDELLVAIDATLPTLGTQIVRTSSSSATVSNLEALEYSSFSQAVWVDVAGGTAGTVFPQGTPGQPVNNLADALSIAVDRGFRTFRILGDITINTNDFSNGYIFVGESETLSTITINAGADVTNCEFRDATVTGTLDGGNTLQDCIANNIDYVDGFLLHCGIEGTLALNGGTTAHIINCHSGVAGPTTPILDLGGSGNACLIRNYSGGLELQNKTGTDAFSADWNSGQIIVDSTCTAGTMIFRGVAALTDNSGSGCDVDVSGLLFADLLQLATFEGAVHIDTSSSVTGTTFPAGTTQFPLNNLADAQAVATERGMTALEVVGTLVVGASDNIDGYTIRGKDGTTPTIVLTAGCTTEGSAFVNCGVTGTLNGKALFSKCGIINLLNVGAISGATTFGDCVMVEGTSSIKTGLASPPVIILNKCTTSISTGTGWAFDFNNEDASFVIRGHIGPVEVQNITAGQSMTLEFLSGELTIANTCNNGTITTAGHLSVVDNSTGTMVVQHIDAMGDFLQSDRTILEKIQQVVKTVLGLSA